VRLLDRIIANLPNDIQENGERVARAIEKYKANPLPDNISPFKKELMLRINASSQRFHDIQTTFQIFFCRHVDDFQTFLEHILRDIAQFEPSILDSVPIKKSARELPIDDTPLMARLGSVGAFNGVFAYGKGIYPPENLLSIKKRGACSRPTTGRSLL